MCTGTGLSISKSFSKDDVFHYILYVGIFRANGLFIYSATVKHSQYWTLAELRREIEIY